MTKMIWTRFQSREVPFEAIQPQIGDTPILFEPLYSCTIAVQTFISECHFCWFWSFWSTFRNRKQSTHFLQSHLMTDSLLRPEINTLVIISWIPSFQFHSKYLNFKDVVGCSQQTILQEIIHVVTSCECGEEEEISNTKEVLCTSENPSNCSLSAVRWGWIENFFRNFLRTWNKSIGNILF